MPTGSPLSCSTGMEIAGLPTMLYGMVSAPLLPRSTYGPATRLSLSGRAGNAQSGLVAEMMKST